MGMSIKESLANLKKLQGDYQQFHDDVWQDSESYGIVAESLKVAINTMRKYQKIQEIIRWNNAPSPYYKPDGQLFREICEVVDNGNDTTNTGSN